MAFREDPDLMFLCKLPSEELDGIVKILMYDKDNKKRYTEGFSSDIRFQNLYPEHSKYWDLIVEEIQKFGANSLVSLFRKGKGVPYKEILCDACDKLKVNYNKKSNTEIIEENLLQKVLTNSIEKMSDEERKSLAESLNLDTSRYTAEAVIISLQLALRNSVFLWGDIAIIVFESVITQVLTRTGVIFTTNILGARALSILAGPIGLALTGAWTALDIAGPAYRVTIPVTIMIACLRKKHSMHKNN